MSVAQPVGVIPPPFTKPIHMKCGWIAVPVQEHHEQEARDRHKHRVEVHKKLVGHTMGAQQWIGDLAELIVNSWLHSTGVQYTFNSDMKRQLVEPEFIVAGQELDIKCSWRNKCEPWGPKPYWTVGVADHQVNKKVDQYFFTIYYPAPQDPNAWMFLLGAMPRKKFGQLATRDVEGVDKHAYFNVNNTMHNVSINQLTYTRSWING